LLLWKPLYEPEAAAVNKSSLWPAWETFLHSLVCPLVALDRTLFKEGAEATTSRRLPGTLHFSISKLTNQPFG
jgi:hypothetical protein